MRDRNEIYSAYMAYYTKTDDESLDLADFCNDSLIEMDDVKRLFQETSDIEAGIWDQLMSNSIDTVYADSTFSEFEIKDKILSLYYTFFENLNLNKDYISLNLSRNSGFVKRKQLFKRMKPGFVIFIESQVEQTSFLDLHDSLKKFKELRSKAITEGFWGQLQYIINFWSHDSSIDGSKTDQAIEKSITVAMDLMDTSKMEHIFDLGKFLWQERKQ